MVKKSQISMEFIMLIGLVFLVFSGFLALMYNQFSEMNEKKDYSAMYNLANLIKKEVLMASKVHDNYIRKFEMPLRINGKDYTAELEKDVLTITNENNLSVTIVLPVEVKGNFIEKTAKGQMKHCITKNKFDGVRIARNQASIELEENAFLKKNNGIWEIPAREGFYAYVRMNCLDNIQTVGFTLELTNLDYVDPGYELIYQYDNYGQLQDQFNNPFFYEKPDEESVIVQPALPYITFIIPQKLGQASSGSGNIVKLRLLALRGPEAKIDFVPDRIILVDNTATQLTEEALPSSNLGATIKVI